MYVYFGVIAFLLSGPSVPCQYTTCFTVDNDTLSSFREHLYKIFCFCSGVDLHISHQNVFSHTSGTQNTSPVFEQYDGWTSPWHLYLCLIVCTHEHGTINHLEILPKDQPDLLRATILSFDFPMMSHMKAVCVPRLCFQLTQMTIHKYKTVSES